MAEEHRTEQKTGELAQRTPSTAESTYPFPRGFMWLPEWWERMSRGEAFEPLRAMMEAEHLRVDETLEDDALVIRAELPGVDPETDVDITVAHGVLTIDAERREERETEEERIRRREIRYGRFSRRLALPEGVKPEEISASYADGILTVRVPMEPKARQAAKIPVTRG